ncbi:hypothetical protein TorRG33x02_303040, partial [Trema orientale]
PSKPPKEQAPRCRHPAIVRPREPLAQL